jgi:hypothetical protein
MRCIKGGPERLAQKRLTDIGNMQPIWKLYGNGSVGSQALLGIPHLAALRNDAVLSQSLACGRSRLAWMRCLAAKMRLPDRPRGDKLVVAADPARRRGGEGCSAGQDDDGPLCALDDAGCLFSLFARPAYLTPEDRKTVEREEGSTLEYSPAGKCSRVLPCSLFPYPHRLAARLPEPHGIGLVRAGTRHRDTITENAKTVLRSTGLVGRNDHGQSVYVLQRSRCRHEYDANGSDIFHGKPGLVY